MLPLIRPEVQVQMWRWRECLGACALVAFGLWAMLSAGGLMAALGAVAGIIGVVLFVLGVQRGRFRGDMGGPGSVDVDEGQITYFGPLTGGSMAIRDLDALALIRTGQSPHWRLAASGQTLNIPIDADGADTLFDAFTALPGLRTERMLSVLRDSAAQDTVIWQRAGTPMRSRQLH